jgi:hypothetical protein
VAKFKNLVGLRFGRLVVAEKTTPYRIKSGKEYSRWICKCDCGKLSTHHQRGLLRGSINSCGCLREEIWKKANIKHGKRHTKVYKCWSKMKSKCNNPKETGYNIYGSRGIKVCDRWLESFDNFLEDMGEPDIGESIDRIDVNGDYEPSNCRWASSIQQARNKRKQTNNTSGYTGVLKRTDKYSTYYTAQWVNNEGKRVTKSFNIKKYGEDIALALAMETRLKGITDCVGTHAEYGVNHGASYSQTEGKKIWGNSNHSHLEYITAFGKYVFTAEKNSMVKGANNIKGTLETLQKQYEADKKYLETIIESSYSVHFRNPEITGVLLGDVISEISSISSSVAGLDVKQKSCSSQRTVNAKLAALLKKLRESAQEK